MLLADARSDATMCIKAFELSIALSAADESLVDQLEVLLMAIE